MSKARQNRKQEESPPQYQYPLAEVEDSAQAEQVERELRRRFSEPNFVFLAIGRGGRGYEIVMDSGTTPLEEDLIAEARTAAAAAKGKIDLSPAE